MTTTATSDKPLLLEMRDIVKSFFGVRVLDQVSITLHEGEVLALLGENGAGKSTLIKILNGDYQRDSGLILMRGQPVHFNEPRDAEAHGIRMIYQEQHFAPELSVAENLLLGHLPKRSGALRGWMVDWPQVYAKAAEYLKLLKVDISPRALMRDLSVVEREIVEIVKALVVKAQIIVMDEPTAALTPHEVDLLFDIIRELRKQGVALIYISHRLDEIPRIADRVTVLRDGKLIGAHAIGDVTQRDIVRMMVGRELDAERGSNGADHSREPVVLSVSGLTRDDAFADVSLDVRRGEIVGIFGLLGAGHAQLSRAIFGAERIHAGQIAVAGQPVAIRSPQDARRAGIGFVPIDRKGQGLVLDMAVRENVTLANWNRLAPLGIFQRKTERVRVGRWVDGLGIRMAGDAEVKTRYLSGGNQQKVVLARWLEAEVKVLLLNEPTWGVDVGARADIYEQLRTLAAQGLAILVVSSDIQEVLAVSQRILTMYKGRITGEFSGAEANQATLLHAAAGGEA
ncbi:MAG: sugar ABC transporter ATP-binding protein [Anaerolineae bacterium]|nr:sugar ABC transporter ATP-binding protein [Anaerolineae bacterium]